MSWFGAVCERERMMSSSSDDVQGIVERRTVPQHDCSEVVNAKSIEDHLQNRIFDLRKKIAHRL